MSKKEVIFVGIEEVCMYGQSPNPLPNVILTFNGVFICKGEMGANSRKLLGLDIVLDYDDAGPNVKHDPRGKRGGKGP